MKFVKNQPALFLPEIRALVISDLHIGIEHELQKSGINIPSQLPEMKKRVEKMIDQTRAKSLIILGDVKHKVPGISVHETFRIPEFLGGLSKRIRTFICLGNHDTYLKELALEGIEIHGSKGFKVGKYGFVHGHAWPSKRLLSCDHLIMGHTHPTIQFKDKFGYRIVEPVWVKGRVRRKKIEERYGTKGVGKLEVIVTPAFNTLLGGTPINESKKSDELFGPLLKNDLIDVENGDLYLLDGTYLGKTKDIG